MEHRRIHRRITAAGHCSWGLEVHSFRVGTCLSQTSALRPCTSSRAAIAYPESGHSAAINVPMSLSPARTEVSMPTADSNGVKIAYDMRGPGGAPAILLIMGLGTQMTA